MADVQRKVIFLTGAPTSNSLRWTEADLTAVLQPCYLNPQRVADGVTSTAYDVAPSWRALPLEQAHLPTGHTQASRDDGPPTIKSDSASAISFFTVSEMSFISNIDESFNVGKSVDDTSDDSTKEVLSQFYEHSFAVHENILSSQILSAGSMSEGSFGTEFEDESLDLIMHGETNLQDQIVRSGLMSGHLCDIADIPNATYLRSITPQTMTVNLVVGIISISQPRVIKTRKTGRTVELVEMLVGDDTRAGFCVNIWLPCMQDDRHVTEEADCLRSRTSKLRSQDIVLAKNVALSSFRGKVHGQSLRKGITTIGLLYRGIIDLEDTRGAFHAPDLEQEALINSQILKVKRVKDWAMQFLVTNVRPPTSHRRPVNRAKGATLQPLPADTQ